MKLKESMELGGQHLLGWLDPEKDYLPTGSWAITHDLGRWWDAMLRLEDVTEFVIPGHMEGANLRNLHWLTDNPDGLLWVPPGLDWQPIKFELHSLREGILTFAALAKYRHNTWASQAGHKYIESIRRGLKPDFSWDFDQFEYSKLFVGGENEHQGHLPSNEDRFPLIVQHGRCIEALVWFYEATGDSVAMELAEDLARFHLTYAINPDGTIPDLLKYEKPGDRQSYLYTLCGLLLHGITTHQSEYVDAVVNAYQVGIPDIVNESGWVAHDLGEGRFPDKTGNPLANTESTGAAARLSLWLALHTGRAECYDDVERLVRARLFPGQTTQADVSNNPDVEIEDKAIGGWGGNDYTHAGKGFNPSGTAEIVHTMCAIFQHICAREEAGMFVNMHFDFEDDDVQVAVFRDDDAAVTVIPRIVDNLFVRIPAWAPDESVRLSVDGTDAALKKVGAFAYVPRERLRSGCEVVLRHGLPARHTSETMPEGDTYEFAWKGDEITGVYPNEYPVPFYPTLNRQTTATSHRGPQATSQQLSSRR